ncbi:hypothetical protein [Microvirga sesbaniae]|uniref:hypothetical protein n=1 Tax=Microvirga sesbaniae TaxID=681392 RepID=UPI0021C86C12|nr:hypothetical protein [Microvirga sp. HBU67692]
MALVVRNRGEAIDFYVNKLRFELVEDTYQPEQDKRSVVVHPPGRARPPASGAHQHPVAPATGGQLSIKDRE